MGLTLRDRTNGHDDRVAGFAATWVDREIAGCEFWDARLGKRFRTLLERIGSAILEPGELFRVADVGPELDDDGAFLDQAKKLLDRTNREAPDFLPAWVRSAEIALEEKRYDDALVTLRAMFTDQQSAPVANAIGVVELRRSATPQPSCSRMCAGSRPSSGAPPYSE